MPTTYLLSIGINRYASEDISTLEGCDIDVKGLQELFLQKGWVKKENCLLLFDEKAGRQQMIDAIRTHFSQLQSGDTALLHFSGHGTTEPTDAAFVRAGHESAHGRNEALVCHDAFLPGIHPLSDKELRWLVAESQQGKEGVTFVGLFDCCHSGSMLKESDRWIKMTAPQRRKRHLSDYLEGQFQDRLDQEGCIQLPAVDYISLTACSPQEYAWGSTVGSLFTTCMMEVLLRHDLPPSYAELHLQLRQLVHPRSGNSQLPQIEYAGHANPYRRFLQAKMTAIASMPNLVKRGEKWFATNGAIHGIDVRAHRDAQLPIYQREQLIGWGMIELVFVEETSILPTWKSTHPTDLNHLFIGLHFMPLSIALTASKNTVHDLATLQDFFAAAKDLHTQVVPQGAKYELQSIGHQLLIHRLENEERKLLIGLEETSSKALDWLRFHWQMIENWERAWTLRTPKQSSIKASSISFLFSYWNAHRPKKTASVEDSFAKIDLPYDPKEGAIFYQIEVSNQHEYLHGLYFYLVHLDRKFGITQKNESYNKKMTQGLHRSLYNSETAGVGLGTLDASFDAIEDTFLLIASETRLNLPQHFHQTGLGENYGKVVKLDSFSKTRRSAPPRQVMGSNWVVKRLTVRLLNAQR